MLNVVLLLAGLSGASAPATFETDTFLYRISEAATSVAFVDKATGEDYCQPGASTPFATWIDDAARPATSARREGDLLIVQFGGAEREARFQVTAAERRLEFALASLHGETGGLRELYFAQIPLRLAGDPAAPFAVSPLALNLETYVAEIPGYAATLSGAKCFAELGMEGAALAVVACPSGELREALQDALASTDGMVSTRNGGPWAYDAAVNQQSYFLDVSGRVNEASIDAWITMLQALGVRQLDLHAGHAFRYGDYVPNPEVYPNGYASLKAVVDKLRAAGIVAGLHTYAMFIAKNTPWVTPVPDPGLAKAATFTLAEALGEGDDVVSVLESTEGMSPLTGFHHRNSATVQVGDELIVFKGVSKTAPYGFTECERGAYGTVVSAHEAGALVHHLKECFGLFAPDPDSELFYKVIDATAKTYNECGFEMMYMDALDGSDVIDLKGGGQFAWYYGAKFTHELVKRLDRVPLMEMSTFGHHLWSVRSRMGAWDATQRAPHTFADIHMMSNRTWDRHFLPTNLGWWAIFDYQGVQPKRSLTEDVEYICGKALGTNSSLSLLLGFNPHTFAESTNQQRLGDIIRRYEDLRLNGAVPPSIREQLAQPGRAFTLSGDLASGWAFRPVDFARHDIALHEGHDHWSVDNPHEAQVPSIRIEALLAASPWDDPKGFVLEDFTELAAYGDVQTQAGVSASVTAGSDPERGGITITAKNESAEAKRAWVLLDREFEPSADLNGRGLGLWVHGDGQGALLNIQLRNPSHVTFAMTEHYVTLDFMGWRYVELIDTADYAIEEYEWPYSKPRVDWEKDLSSAMSFAYPMYHAHLNYGQIGGLRIGLNNIQPGAETTVMLGEIRAIPHRETTFSNPTLRFAGGEIAFPVPLASGSMLEFVPPKAYTVYDKKGDIVSAGEIEGAPPELGAGANVVTFTCAPEAGVKPHARVTLTLAGDMLHE